MLRILSTSLLSCLLITSAFAQSASTTMGARVAGLGNASTVLTDEWSILNNIGGLAKVKEVSTAFSFEMKPAMPGSSRMAAVFVTPIKVGTMGVGVFKFGDDLYSEQILTAGYSNQFGIASLGIKINYIQYRKEGFGTDNVLSVSAGGTAEITPQLSIGAYLQNVNQPKLINDERLPARLGVGIGFKPIEEVLLIAEVEKDVIYDPIIKTGIEYAIHKKIFARTGFNLNPDAAFFGLGFKGWRIKIDYAIQYNSAINFGHQASACYRIERPRTKLNQEK